MNKYALRRVIVLLTIALLCARAADVVVRLVREQESQTYLPSINVPLPLVPVRTTKKGIGLAYPNFADDARNAGASWCYNWSPGGSCGDDSIEFVAMVWGRVIPQTISASVILGANEPDIESQSNIAPEEYAVIWREIETRFLAIWLNNSIGTWSSRNSANRRFLSSVPKTSSTSSGLRRSLCVFS